MKKFRRILALSLSLVMSMSLFAGCGKEDDSARDNETLLNINGIEVPLKVGKFYAYNEQASYEAYYLANGYSLDWSSLYEEETTKAKEEATTAEGATTEEATTAGKYPIEDLVKKDIIERIKMFYVVSQYAKENGATLTEEDTKEINEFVKNYLEGNKKVIEATKADEEFLVGVYGIESYYNKGCDMIFKDVDWGIKDEDVRQTKIIAVELASDKIEFPEDSAKAFLARLQAGEDFKEIANAYGMTSLIVEGSLGKGDFGGDKVEELALSLKAGESGYVVENDVHIVIYCVDDNDEEATNSVKEALIAEKKAEKLLEFYEEYTKGMEITVNEELWATVNFDKAIFTEEDVSDILKDFENQTTTTEGTTTTTAK